MKYFNKIQKNINPNYFNILFLFLLFYVVIYYVFFKPLFKTHELQTKEWISELTDNIVLGVNDRSKFEKINRKCDFISFWYCYWFFQTNKYTGWILFNMKNKFSDEISLCVYLYDFVNNKKTTEVVPLKFSNVKTSKNNNTLIINCGNDYKHEMNFLNNHSTISIKTNQINMQFELLIDDYTTNQSSFLPRYQFLNNFVNVEGSNTNTPGEWMSDNPYIGKIINGKINNDIIEKGGNFWFDNFIGCNNYFLEPYIWFIVLNDDWMIYLLWFDVYETRNEIGTYKPILIKNRKTNKFIYSGSPGAECKRVPFPLNKINYALQPMSMTYDSNKKLGDENYDDYSVSFKSDEINIQIDSIKNKSNMVFKYDYYKNNDADKSISKMNAWDKNYYNILSNIVFVEYINMVNVKIEYDGKTEKFESRQVIDAMYLKDSTISYKFN